MKSVAVENRSTNFIGLAGLKNTRHVHNITVITEVRWCFGMIRLVRRVRSSESKGVFSKN